MNFHSLHLLTKYNTRENERFCVTGTDSSVRLMALAADSVVAAVLAVQVFSELHIPCHLKVCSLVVQYSRSLFLCFQSYVAFPGCVQSVDFLL